MGGSSGARKGLAVTEFEHAERAIDGALRMLPQSEETRRSAIAIMLARAWALARVAQPELRAHWATCAYHIADELAAPSDVKLDR